MKDDQITIDAKGQTLGRVASAAAKALRGKEKATFERNITPSVKVKIINVNSLHISAKKRTENKYVRYTGYPGGLRETTLQQLITKKTVAEPLRRAIHGMLPDNKLRKPIMKNLIIEL